MVQEGSDLPSVVALRDGRYALLPEQVAAEGLLQCDALVVDDRCRGRRDDPSLAQVPQQQPKCGPVASVKASRNTEARPDAVAEPDTAAHPANRGADSR